MTAPSYSGRVEEARAILADMRARLDPHAVEAAVGGPAALDQLAAAARDARRLLRAGAVVAAAVNAGGRPWSLREGPAGSTHGLDALARTLVAVDGFTYCAHLRRTPAQPAVARMPLRRVDCGRCLHTFRRPPADEADRCDWCGARGVELFTPVAIGLGPLVAAGDACDDCAAALNDGDEAG
jgi:hypothetical protein